MKYIDFIFFQMLNNVWWAAAGFFAKSTPECDDVVGVASGDTCFTIAQSFNLTAASFDAINPNISCNALFVGQWICVAGSV
jgi:hypothetical protein